MIFCAPLFLRNLSKTLTGRVTYTQDVDPAKELDTSSVFITFTSLHHGKQAHA